MGTLGDIPSDLARWYARRLRYLWTTSVNEGLGFFIVYTILIATAAILAQSSLSRREKDEIRLDEFLQSDHQVRDADRFVSALSVVLSALRPEQRITAGMCPKDSAECRRARNVIDATVEFARLISSRASTETAVSVVRAQSTGQAVPDRPDDLADVAAILSSSHLPVEAARMSSPAIDSGVIAMKKMRLTLPPPKASVGAHPAVKGEPKNVSNTSDKPFGVCESTLDPPGIAEQERSRRDQFGLHQAVCQRVGSDVSGLQIPEQIAEFGSLENATDKQVANRVSRAIAVSYALEAALRAGTSHWADDQAGKCPCCQTGSEPVVCPRERETRTFTAAYFVSVDSVLRYWREEANDPTIRLPKNLLWAAREYFTTVTPRAVTYTCRSPISISQVPE